MQKAAALLIAFIFSILVSEAQNDNLQKGVPGPSSTIIIRDAPSVTTTEPLVIVDSFITDMKSMALNPSNVESISVLKGASATALYGSKGVNGVILIKTKPGIEFYTINDFVNAEKNTGVQAVKLNENVLTDMKKLLVEKTALKQTLVSSNFRLDENCKAVLQNMLVVTTASTN